MSNTSSSRIDANNISNKVTERRLKWFGHVQRRPLEHACRQIIDMKPAGKRKRGIPRTIWMDAENRDMKMMGLERKMVDKPEEEEINSIIKMITLS